MINPHVQGRTRMRPCTCGTSIRDKTTNTNHNTFFNLITNFHIS